MRLLTIESLLYALVGAVAGIVLGGFTLDLLLGLQPPNVPRLENVSLDGTVLGFSLAVALFSTVLFGLAPAFLAASGTHARSASSSRATASHGRRRLSRALVVAEDISTDLSSHLRFLS